MNLINLNDRKGRLRSFFRLYFSFCSFLYARFQGSALLKEKNSLAFDIEIKKVSSAQRLCVDQRFRCSQVRCAGRHNSHCRLFFFKFNPIFFHIFLFLFFIH